MTIQIVISGSGSHCGKTTIACGLLSSFREHGLKVCAYKTGPDYIDTEYLRNAAQCEAYNLDTWLMSPERVHELFMMTSRGKDIAVIEGAMGLYDGGMNSTAEIAKLLHAPGIAVIDAKSIGETAAALALGLREYDRDVNLAGVILNRAGSDSHIKIISDALESKGIKLLGALKRNDRLIIPERHLGLLPMHENMNYDFDSVRAIIESSVDVDEVLRASESACEVHECINESSVEVHEVLRISGSSCETHESFSSSSSSWPCVNHNVRVAVARDEAFSFYYPESIDTLRHLGAEIVYFSPVHDTILPKADGYIFGGGFPEMFARELEENTSMRESVRECACSDVPVLAECGGFMYLCDSMTDINGKRFNMAGVIHCDSFMTDKPVIGYIEARALSENLLCDEGDVIRGHEFHYSRMKNENSHAFMMTRRRTGESYAGGYAKGNILASYLHINFFGNTKLSEHFLSRIDINQTSR